MSVLYAVKLDVIYTVCTFSSVIIYNLRQYKKKSSSWHLVCSLLFYVSVLNVCRSILIYPTLFKELGIRIFHDPKRPVTHFWVVNHQLLYIHCTLHLLMGLLPCARVSSWWTQNCSLESITFVFVERISARAIRPLLPLLSPYDLFLVSDSRFCLKASPIVKTECLGQATGDIWFSLWGWKASIRLFFPVFCTSGERRIGWAEPFVSWSPLIHVVLLYAPWVWIHCSEIETSWHVIVINL